MSYPHDKVYGIARTMAKLARELAEKGFEPDQIREAMVEMAEDAADEAIAWAAAYDRQHGAA